MKNPFCLLLLFTFSLFFSFSNLSAENIYKTISAEKCDSLVKANVENPNFVILDVRTPSSWIGDHLQGSINRNYYDSDIDAQLNALPKHKTFLIHCQGGSRSAGTLTKMRNFGFSEVYEMQGGISSWKNKGYPTTSELAPKIMLASNNGIATDTIVIDETDTLQFTITNRGNDTLKFSSIDLPFGDEFSANFDINTKLKGAEDYTFEVYYSPKNIGRDSTKIIIESNGGQLQLNIVLKTETLQNINSNNLNELVIYPNPAQNNLYFKSSSLLNIEEISLINLNGQVVLQESYYSISNGINISGLISGVYFVRIKTKEQSVSKKLLVKH
ncbi:MAG: T9SS type A sorting domain-containing protein [Bacteroidetes bacterium]|nr:T9SS type A sorting domain-containing protein [Bacteroidota bacterium]